MCFVVTQYWLVNYHTMSCMQVKVRKVTSNATPLTGLRSLQSCEMLKIHIF
jgi:hypothetical protein